jgi:aldose 1-epimerase
MRSSSRSLLAAVAGSALLATLALAISPAEGQLLRRRAIRNQARTARFEVDNRQGEVSMETKSFGKTAEGEEVKLFTCTNAGGSVLKLTDYGASVVSVEVPDRDGKLANVNLGFERLDGYLGGHPFFGATVGRFCNRIAGGRFTLDGKEYQLAKNNGPHHLHGGDKGFNRYVWKSEAIADDDAVGVRFTHTSPDGDENYPGTLRMTATYTLTNENELRIELTATTDKPTVVNLTNHNYWNLAGAGSGNILDHVLTLEADKYLPVDDTLIPTGELAAVKGTPFDFTKPTAIGSRFDQLQGDPTGYDHCYVLRGQDGKLALAARVQSPKSGRVMEIYTTQPGVQLYTGNFLDGSAANGGNQQHEGFCLETQHYPDSPNKPEFPTTVLRPGETFRAVTVHRFFAE